MMTARSIALIPLALGACNAARAQSATEAPSPQAARAQYNQELTTPQIDTLYDPQEPPALIEHIVPGYERPGIQAGSFTIYPQLTVSLTGTDNIFASNTTNRGAAGTTIAPSVSAIRDVDHNRLALSADATVNRYFSQSDNKYDTFDFLATDKQDLGSDVTIGVRAGYRRQAESRTYPGAIDFTESPILFNVGEVGATIAWKGPRLSARAVGSLSSVRYEDGRLLDGSVYDTSFGNRNRQRATIQVDYSIGADLALRVQGSYARSSYLHETASGLDRSSNRYELLGGVAFNFTQFLTGEVAVGYIDQSFRDPRFRSFSGFGARATVQYQPTQLTTFTLKASRTIEESGLPTAPSYLSTGATLQVDHELYRNLQLSAYVRYSTDKFQLPDRSEHRPGAGASALYRLNRSVVLIASYDFLRISSSPADLGRNLSVNFGSIGINVGI